MRTIKWMTVVLILVFSISISCRAADTAAGLETQTLSEEEVSVVLQQRKFTRVTSYSPLVVKCFDVRDDHTMLIGADAGNAAVVAVYNDSGTFQYGFQTEEGGSFRAFWNGDVIVYYSIRSKLAFEIDENGEIVHIYRVANTVENSIYDRKVLLSTTRTIDDHTYRMTNKNAVANYLFSSFDTIVKTSVQGDEVIYDASDDRTAHVTVGAVVALVVASIFAGGTIIGIKKIKQNKHRATVLMRS